LNCKSDELEIYYANRHSVSRHSVPVQSVQSKQETLLQRLDELDHDNEALRSQVADLEDSRDQLQQQISRLTDDKQQLQQQIDDNHVSH